MRLIFMGSAPIAVPTLQYLLSKHDLAAVVTQPDKPAGRKRVLTPTAVKTAALGQVPVLEPGKLKAAEFVEQLRDLQPQVVVVMAYGRLVPSVVLQLPRWGCVNIHGSILPQYRGPCPIERAIMDGQPSTGITTFFMDEGFDTGDMILWESIPIADDDSGGSLREKLSQLAVDVIDRTLALLARGAAPRIPQDKQAGCHAPIIRREEACINWALTSHQIDCMVRACDPEPGAYTIFRGQPLKVRRVRVRDEQGGAEVGTVCADGAVIASGSGAVELMEVLPAGKRWMAGNQFVAGYKPLAGESLGTCAGVV